MSVKYTTVYKRVIVLTFGAAASALLLYLIWRNAVTDYEMGTLTLFLLGSIILGTIGVDVYALQEHQAAGALTGETGPPHDSGEDNP